MFFKQKLIDQSVYLKKIPKKFTSINLDTLKKDALKSFENKKFLNSNEFSVFKNYYKTEDNVNIRWTCDLIRDYFRVLTPDRPETLVILNSSYIILNRSINIDLHSHIDEYDLNNSPDMSALVVLDTEDDSFVEFEYEGGRKRHMKQRVPLIKNEIVLFNSELKHRFLHNKSFNKTILLSFQMQLI